MHTSKMAHIKNGLGRVLLRTRIGRAWGLPVLCLLATTAMVAAGDFSYMINNDNTIAITGYTGPGGALTIPGTINNLPVTRIGHMAFYRCTSLTRVMIPNGVTTLKQGPDSGVDRKFYRT